MYLAISAFFIVYFTALLADYPVEFFNFRVHLPFPLRLRGGVRWFGNIVYSALVIFHTLTCAIVLYRIAVNVSVCGACFE
jgi:hypothetical protein